MGPLLLRTKPFRTRECAKAVHKTLATSPVLFNTLFGGQRSSPSLYIKEIRAFFPGFPFGLFWGWPQACPGQPRRHALLQGQSPDGPKSRCLPARKIQVFTKCWFGFLLWGHCNQCTLPMHHRYNAFKQKKRQDNPSSLRNCIHTI